MPTKSRTQCISPIDGAATGTDLPSIGTDELSTKAAICWLVGLEFLRRDAGFFLLAAFRRVVLAEGVSLRLLPELELERLGAAIKRVGFYHNVDCHAVVSNRRVHQRPCRARCDHLPLTPLAKEIVARRLDSTEVFTSRAINFDDITWFAKEGHLNAQTRFKGSFFGGIIGGIAFDTWSRLGDFQIDR